MITVTIKKDGKIVHDLQCISLCLSYNDGSKIQSIVSTSEPVSVSDLTLLGCSSAASVIQTVSNMKNNEVSEPKRTPKFLTRVS